MSGDEDLRDMRRGDDGVRDVTRTDASERVFARLVALFPAPFREQFGDDMRDVFRDQLRAARQPGGVGIARLWTRTVPRIARAILLEHFDAHRERRALAREHPTFTIRGDGMLAPLLTDLRLAVRMLRKTPVFSAVAILVVALGTGAVSTIYSAANAIVLRSLPGTTDGQRLVGLRRTEPNGRAGISGSPEYLRFLGERSRSLQSVGGWSRISMTLGIGADGGGLPMHGNIVSGNYFELLGVHPAAGRFFAPMEDSVPLAHPVMVISHDFWTSRLGGDPGIFERPVVLNGHRYHIIGVAPRGFTGVFTALQTDAWVPLAMHEQLRQSRDVGAHTPWMWAIGRLADGVDRDVARRELSQLTAEFAASSGEPPAFAANTQVSVSPLTGLPDDARRLFLGFLGVLFAAAALVLMIASVNVASMLSARAVARRREMAVRTALGAARGRLVRQLLTETLLLFALGALGGIGLAWAATSALERLHIPSTDGLTLEISPDPNVLTFALAVALLTGIAFGLVPALQGTDVNVAARLRGESSASTTRRSFFGNALIVGQLALSLTLLVAAGLFGRALAAGASVDPGFDQVDLTVAMFNSESWGYDPSRARTFYASLLERASTIPGVRIAAYTEQVPLVFDDNRRPAQVPARGGGLDTVHLAYGSIAAGYFDAMRIPILRGRPLLASDDALSPRVAVINERFAQHAWPGEEAVGRTFNYEGGPVTVVGVARDSKYGSLSETTPPFAYFSMQQFWRHDHILLLRTDPGATHVGRELQRIVAELDPLVPRPVARPITDETSLALLPQRIAAIVTAALGGLGLFLATVGLYGVISYSTSRRSREIGIRIAVGARASDVLRMVVREGMRLTGVGVLIGLGIAAAAAQLIERFLHGVSPLDAVAYASTAALLVAVALLATYLPARRAAAADPMIVLRSE